MTYHHEKVKTALVRRTAHWLCQRSWPHVAMFVACVLGFAAWWSLANSLASIPWFAARYGLSAVGAYAAWFLCLGAWFLMQPRLDSRRLIAEIDAHSSNRPLTADEERQIRLEMTDQVSHEAGNLAFETMFQDPRAAFGLLGLFLLGGGPIVAMFLLIIASKFLAELLVVGGKVQHPSAYAPPVKPWHIDLFDRTKWFALALILHYTLVALLVQLVRPNAAGMWDALKP